MRNFFVFFLLLICQGSYCQEYKQFQNCRTEYDFNKYFKKNLSQLDPLEGIYVFNLGLVRQSQYEENRQVDEFNIAIVKDYDDKFYIYMLDDEEWFTRDLHFVKMYENTYYSIDNALNEKTKFVFDGYNFDCSYEMSANQKSKAFQRIGRNVRAFVIRKGSKTFPTLKMYQQAIEDPKNKITEPSSGTGFLFHKNGYIITNYHVIENAQNNNIKITSINENCNEKYSAEVLVTDKQNDLAILKITDIKFAPLTNIPYTFKFNTSSIGEDCFVLGYPLISSMGKDIKLTNGIISSKTGYDGNVAQYQISAPIQAGNSGAPLFDKDGNIIGVVQAKHTLAENAGYAIKSSYIRNLIDLLPTAITLPQNNVLKGKTLPQQVELASKAVCIIIVNGD